MSDELNVNKITAEVITDFGKTITSNIWGSIKKYAKDVKNKDQIDYGYAFDEYLQTSFNKYCKIKTLLYRHEPKDLYSFYECIGVRFNDVKIDTCSVKNITEIGHNIIITGTGGIGKSTMMKHFFLNCIAEESYIPVLVELRSFNDKDIKDISIIDTIFETITNGRFSLEKEYFLYSLESGCYLILFDGYDEVKQNITEKITKEITGLCSKYPYNYYIVSSRPTDEFIGWTDFIELKSLSLTKEQALSLIEKLEYDIDVKQSFYKQLDDILYDKYITFASNPLLLTIMLLTFENRAAIPDKLNEFYEQAFSALYNVHDATKGAYKRDIKCGLGYEDFKMVFAYICFKSYFRSQYEFTESSLMDYINQAKLKLNKDFCCEHYKEDLVKSVCMLIRDGLNFKFSHRSFQEYFAALYTCKLTDDVQKKLVTSWLKNGGRGYKDNYINMLFDLQTEKCNKIILLPGLKILKKKYEEVSGSIPKLMLEIFEALDIHKANDRDKISFFVKDSYIMTILSLAANYNNYSYSGVEVESDLVKILDKYRDKEAESDHEIFDFNELITYGVYDDVAMKCVWFKEQVEFSLSLYDTLSKKTLGNKRNISAILQDL